MERRRDEVPAVARDLTVDQWSLADEVAGDLRVYITMMSRLEKDGALPDAFAEWLTVWCVLLGALAWDAYTAIIVLLRAKKVRSAYALSRALYDYFVRLVHYREQARPIMEEWRADARKMKNVKNGLQKVDAWRDWFTINRKMADHLRRMQPDLSDMTPDELSEFEAALEASAHGDLGNRPFRDMLKSAWPDDQHAQEFTYTQWLQRSAYLHGDPLTRIDVLGESVVGDRAEYDLRLDQSIISEVHVLTGATAFVLGLMEQAHQITGRHYALRVLAPKVVRMFPFRHPSRAGATPRGAG